MTTKNWVASFTFQNMLAAALRHFYFETSVRHTFSSFTIARWLVGGGKFLSSAQTMGNQANC